MAQTDQPRKYAVVASRYDPAALAFVERWAARGACLLSAEDLSTAGWRTYFTNQPGAETQQAVIGGQPVAVLDLGGVLIRRTHVFKEELSQIVPADRAYVAAEITAFLLAWLSALPCPLLNRPTASSLIGTAWRPEQWTLTAARLGLPVCPILRQIREPVIRPNPFSAAKAAVWVTIVGRRWFGEVDPELARQARRLADAARVDLLSVAFSGSQPGAAFVSASLSPDLSTDEVGEAIFAYFQEASPQ